MQNRKCPHCINNQQWSDVFPISWFAIFLLSFYQDLIRITMSFSTRIDIFQESSQPSVSQLSKHDLTLAIKESGWFWTYIINHIANKVDFGHPPHKLAKVPWSPIKILPPRTPFRVRFRWIENYLLLWERIDFPLF